MAFVIILSIAVGILFIAMATYCMLENDNFIMGIFNLIGVILLTIGLFMVFSLDEKRCPKCESDYYLTKAHYCSICGTELEEKED